MSDESLEREVKTENNSENNPTRRSFLKMASAAAAGGVGAMVLPKVSQAQEIIAGLTSAAPADNATWANVISKFNLDPQIIYMNTGTEGSMPRQVLDNLCGNLAKFSQSPSYSVMDDAEFGAGQSQNRARVAQFMGATEDEIVMATNTTMGMNVILQGLDLAEGDEIITTRHDHLAGTSPMHILRDRANVTISELTLPSPVTDKQQIIDSFAAAITANTKMLCFCHINYTTGLRMPVKELCQLAQDNGLMTLVDGAHSLGMVEIDLHDLGCDFYACAGHKWLNGPPGTGVLYIKDGANNPHNVWPILSEMYDLTKPIYPGGPSIFTVPLAMQIRGQCNTPAFTAMVEAMNFQEAIGPGAVEERILTLNDYLKEKIIAQWGEQCLVSPAPGHDELNSGLAAFVPSADPSKRFDKSFITGITTKLKEEHGVWFRYTSYYDSAADLPGRYSRGRSTYVIRASTHIFNSYLEIDEAFNALVEVAEGM
ncbi:MAG: aminotransferase class V-fold PLP-dependent enzyme [Thermodesulfobacteriota bacterium]